MEDVKLVERMMVLPETPTPRRRVFLSNIDLTLVAYQESVSFFDPPANQMSLSEAFHRLCRAISHVLVSYDFLAGRLVPSLEASNRLEIDCNNAGFVVAAATTKTTLSQLGELMAPKPEFERLVAFLREEAEDELELKDKPLGFFQLTQFGCGGLALGSRYYHCILDGVAIHDLEMNLASLTRGEGLVVVPNPDRSIFRARNPPQISHPHFEYSRAIDTDSPFTLRGTSDAPIEKSGRHDQIHLIHLSPINIQGLKKAALRDGKLKNCTTFQAVAAKIWKARSIAVEMAEGKISTMLFPVDTRTRVVPQAPVGFAGNALVPCREDSFSLVAWWRLGLEEEEFAWGRLTCASPVVVKPGIVFLLPGPTAEGGLNIFLELEGDQVVEFRRLMMED